MAETQSQAQSEVQAGVPEGAAGQDTRPTESGQAPPGEAATAGESGAGLPGAEGAVPTAKGDSGGAAKTNLSELVSGGEATNSTGKILGLVEQAKSGGMVSDGMDSSAGVLDFADVLKDCRIPAMTEEESASVDLDTLYEQLQIEREYLLQLASSSRQQVMADAQTYQETILQSIEAETLRLEEAYAQATEQVRTTAESARLEIETNRQAQIDGVNAASETQLINLPLLVEQKKTEIRQVGEDKAQAAETFGESEAQRAIDGCNDKADAARQLGQDKAAQYSGYDKAADIARAARNMASEAARSIRSAGQDMARTARQDMANLATKFRQEAEQAADSFDGRLSDARAEIERERQEAIDNINRVADEALSQIETASADTIAQLQANEQEAIAQLSQAGQDALPQIEQAALAAGERIDQDAALAIARLETFVTSEVVPQFSNACGPVAQESLAEVQAQISGAIGEVEVGMSLFVADMQQSFQEQAMQVHEQVVGYVDGVNGQLGGICTTFESQASEISSRVIEEMERAASHSIQNIEQIVINVETGLQATIDQNQTQWDQELTQGQNELERKINDGLAEQDAALIELARAIDERAEEIERQSWLEAIGRFFTGLFSGLISFVENISGILARVLTVIVNVVASFIVGLVDIVSRVLEALWDAIVAVFTFLWGVVVWIVSALVWLLGQLASLFLALVAWIASWFGGWTWLEETLQSLRENVAMMGTFLLDPFTGDFYGCDETQEDTLRRAATQAVLLGNSALAKLSASPLDPATSVQFNHFFMSTAPEHVAEARGVLGEAIAGLQGNPTDLKCEASGSTQCTGANAYTSQPFVPYVSLHFCADFINSATDREIALVVIHEATHKHAGTDDHAYFGAVLSLSTDEALDNADTYEQFVDAMA